MKNHKGFTLMELTIVLAILAIIAVILIPAFLNTTDRARLRSDIQSARVIQNAMDLYRAERGQAVEGVREENMVLVLENLTQAGFIAARDTDIQTEGARWIIDDGQVMVYIRYSPDGVHRAYTSLSDAEQRLVRS